MKETFNIDVNSQVEDNELILYFTPLVMEFIKTEPKSTASIYSSHFLNSLLRNYTGSPEKIGFIFRDKETLLTSLGLILKGYDEYIHTAFLRGISLPFCQADSDGGYQNGSPKV